ncbi:glycogen debranching enzyme [bacterium BMS3Abin09]|nr:glycogen debranching enzyme [bacterium BMS3Abin09]GBE40216.1 glycogen debranching enzyme [bacterium BMS3Bbin09]
MGVSISKGYPLPPGAHLRRDGANFALLSRHATAVCLLMFDDVNGNPSQMIELDPSQNKTGDIWHVWVEGIKENQLYAYKIDGPFSPDEGHWFNRHKLILDPYARAVTRQDDFIEDALAYDPRSPRNQDKAVKEKVTLLFKDSF